MNHHHWVAPWFADTPQNAHISGALYLSGSTPLQVHPIIWLSRRFGPTSIPPEDHTSPTLTRSSRSIYGFRHTTEQPHTEQDDDSRFHSTPSADPIWGHFGLFSLPPHQQHITRAYPLLFRFWTSLRDWESVKREVRSRREDRYIYLPHAAILGKRYW